MTDTTTPQMTPEQRAHFCRLLNNARLGECANQLEADGVTIATLTAERDAAQAEIARLTAENSALSSWQCVFTDGKTGLVCDDYGNQFCTMQRRAEAAESALATAREDGMREARDAAYRYAQDCLDDGRFHAQAHCLEVATEIETAIKEGAAT